MKPYARQFYNSRQWRETRDAYFKSQDGLCEQCGSAGQEVHHKKHITIKNINDPKITLDWANLQLLCRECHFKAHEQRRRVFKPKPTYTLPRLQFDSQGQPVPVGRRIIVWGSPASGKSTWAMEQMKQGDIIIDLDNILQCFTGLSNKDTPEDQLRPYLDFAENIRDYVLRQLDENPYNITTAYVIAGLPRKKEREQMALDLRAELKHIDTSRERCIENALQDSSRTDKAFQERIINRHFERLEL